MGIRMKDSTSDWIRPYMLAAQLEAESGGQLGASIAHAGATIGGAMRDTKHRNQAQSNWEATFKASVADRDADNRRAMLQILDKEAGNLQSQLDASMGDPEAGIEVDQRAVDNLTKQLNDNRTNATMLQQQLLQSSIGGGGQPDCPT